MTVTFGIDLWELGEAVEWDGARWRVTRIEELRQDFGPLYVPLYRYTLDRPALGLDVALAALVEEGTP